MSVTDKTSITDELRQWAEQHMSNANTLRKSLLKVADRIDDEIEHHYLLNKEVENRYLPLPVDADGEIIHFGDMLYSEQAGGSGLFSVYSIEMFEDGLATIASDDGYFSGVDSDSCHRPENTVENILLEAIAAYDNEASLSSERTASIVAKYAERIRSIQ